MLTVEELKRRACETIERRKKEIIGVAQQVLSHPEAGFREHRTAGLVAQKFNELQIPHESGLALTGLKGRISGGAGAGPRVALIGELDSLVVTEHPHADPETGAAHACGHHCQLGMMLGATMGLMTPEVLENLNGEIIPFAVPAEEFIEVEQRLELRAQKKLEFMGGKQELIRLGQFDDVDIAMMCHTASDMGERKFAIGGTSNGHVVKYVRYKGVGAHAGSSPHLGVNALNAAAFALQAINANRETHRAEDTVRIHGIITKGGEAVNAGTGRGQAGVAGAVIHPAGGGEELRGGRPVLQIGGAGRRCAGGNHHHPGLPADAQRHPPAGHLPGQCQRDRRREGDDGDAGQPQPRRLDRHGRPIAADSRHPPVHWRGTGPGHSKSYIISDYETAVINPAKIMAMAVVDLLADGAKRAKEVKSSHKAAMSRSAYLRFQRDRARTLQFDGAAE